MTTDIYFLNIGPPSHKATAGRPLTIMNNTIKLTIQLSFLCIASHTLCMMDQKQKRYKSLCLKICNLHEQKLHQYQDEIITKTPQYFEQETINIKQIFQDYKNNLIAKTHKLLTDIQEYHNIDRTLWNECKKVITDTLQLHISSPKAYHDTIIQIDPCGITINKKESVPLYHIKNPIPHLYTDSSRTQREPVEITINENYFLQLPKSYQGAICACIVEDITRGLSLIPDIIAELEPFTKKDSLIQSAQFVALQTMCTKKLPIFLACLNDPNTACSMLQIIPDHYYNDFTMPDYILISKINMYWDMLKWIKIMNKAINGI
jgi:hypothetical protein